MRKKGASEKSLRVKVGTGETDETERRKVGSGKRKKGEE